MTTQTIPTLNINTLTNINFCNDDTWKQTTKDDADFNAIIAHLQNQTDINEITLKDK